MEEDERGRRDRSRALAADFLANAPDEPREWQDVVYLAKADLWLTVEETRTVTAALDAALEPYRDRSVAGGPDGSRRVRVMSLAVPHRRPDLRRAGYSRQNTPRSSCVNSRRRPSGSLR